MSNPRFKLDFLTASSRASNPETEAKCKELLLQAASKYSADNKKNSVSLPTTSDTADYYGFKVKCDSTKSSSNSAIDVIKYLEDPSDNLCMLSKYPSVKKVFVRFNSALPSSAPVERMFSMAGKIHSPSRTLLTSDNFRKSVLMKANTRI